MTDPLETKLARLSADEMVAALGAGRAPAIARRLLVAPFLAASRPVAAVLAGFDRDTASIGLVAGAAGALRRFDVRVAGDRVPPAAGAALVLANHPGAYDALALMAVAGRDDLAILAAERTFLRALPTVARHLVFVPEAAGARATALRIACRHLRRGGAVLHFPAGVIEPDPAFGGGALLPWAPGVGVLARAASAAGGRVLVAGVRGVHSPSVKRLPPVRVAERFGITTLSPLLQVLFGVRDVEARVAMEDVTGAVSRLRDDDAALVNALRERLAERCASVPVRTTERGGTVTVEVPAARLGTG